jgi:hypothetical protein
MGCRCWCWRSGDEEPPLRVACSARCACGRSRVRRQEARPLAGEERARRGRREARGARDEARHGTAEMRRPAARPGRRGNFALDGAARARRRTAPHSRRRWLPSWQHQQKGASDELTLAYRRRSMRCAVLGGVGVEAAGGAGGARAQQARGRTPRAVSLSPRRASLAVLPRRCAALAEAEAEGGGAAAPALAYGRRPARSGRG